MSDLPQGLVAIPAEEKMWTRSVCALMRLQQAVPEASFTWQVNATTIATKRDTGVALLLNDPDYRWLLFLDSDMDPPQDTIHRLWATAESEGADIVQAAMVQKEPPHAPTGAVVQEHGEPEDPFRPWTTDPDLRFGYPSGESLARGPDPFPLDAAGTGCLLVRRRVFEALDEPWFCAMPDGKGSDYNATLRMTREGFRAVLDPGCRVGHVAGYSYDVQDAARCERDQRRQEQLEARARRRMDRDGRARLRKAVP